MASKKEEISLNNYFLKLSKQVIDGQMKGNSAMVQVAVALYKMADEKFLPFVRSMGFKTLEDYSMEKFGISKSSFNDATRVIGCFGNSDYSGINPDFSEYTFTQLKLMSRVVGNKARAEKIFGKDFEYASIENMTDAIKDKFPATMSSRDMEQVLKEAPARISKKADDKHASATKGGKENGNNSVGADTGVDMGNGSNNVRVASTPESNGGETGAEYKAVAWKERLMKHFYLLVESLPDDIDGVADFEGTVGIAWKDDKLGVGIDLECYQGGTSIYSTEDFVPKEVE